MATKSRQKSRKLRVPLTVWVRLVFLISGWFGRALFVFFDSLRVEIFVHYSESFREDHEAHEGESSLSRTARLNQAGTWSVFSSRMRPPVTSASQVRA